jgi:protein ImuA
MNINRTYKDHIGSSMTDIRAGNPDRAAIRAALGREIARIEGRLPTLDGAGGWLSTGAPGLDAALGGGLATAGLHEIMPAAAGDSGAAAGFALALAARLAPAAGPLLLVGEIAAEREAGLPYGPGLAAQGLDPARLVLVRAERAADALWALEEALASRAAGLALAVFAGRPAAYDFTCSRRLALAAVAAGRAVVPLFLGRGGLADAASAATTRWEIAARPSLPGAAGTGGAARCAARLVRNRHGRPLETLLEWNHDARSFADGAPHRRDRAALPADRTHPPRAAPRAYAAAG